MRVSVSRSQLKPTKPVPRVVGSMTSVVEWSIEPPPEKRREDRPERPERERAPRSTRSDLATYRIAVGKRHKVGPGSIVGAIANEGGLHRSDFGHITIKSDFSLVELPAKLSAATLKALEKTRISGVLINLQPDRGGPSYDSRPSGGKPRRQPR